MKLISGNPTTLGQFGYAVGCSAAWIIVGAFAEQKVYVFSTQNYSAPAIILAATGSSSDFGISVDILGNNLAIGSPSEMAVYFYTWNGTTWSLVNKYLSTTEGFGSEVELDSYEPIVWVGTISTNMVCACSTQPPYQLLNEIVESDTGSFGAVIIRNENYLFV